MSVNVKRDKNKLIIDGELDRFNLSDDALYEFLAFDDRVEIDLEKVINIDTAGVAYLLKVVDHYQKLHKLVTICGGSEQLIALANISNVLELLPLHRN
ncbi:STAS domain-containing protein [Psychrosphaera sp. B3R10]|uniref:STAS domain-containing protein n=1 Tax=unclassified Psychrosphaera TaxID=2641570 RepID=UPI001C09A55F|nr:MULTISPECIES: STAS domain-containing protein [unclassified Psychrosphaera]MBU2881933.1 STAS domain-containing protein [Psychrosphaera sp. I2R16]MBU2991244.1 STAS domain-containing protein [Psychrosphaera sp. B3R10]MDO6720990.1 STAS domain-containing protein [Psychrosphaera sp. 1_MG-2023]